MARKYLKYFTLLFLIIIVIFIITGFKTRVVGKAAGLSGKADGEGVNLSIYNRTGKELMTLNCIEENELDTGSDGIEKILMKDIKASIYKNGRMDKDIFVTAKEGYRENDINFMFKKNARIFAEDLLITSRSFYLKDRNILTADGKVKIKVSDLEGTAVRGMKYNIQGNLLVLKEFRGKLTKNERIYQIHCSLLRLPDDKKKIRLDGVKQLKQADSSVQCKVFEFHFTEDYKFIKKTLAFGGIEFYLRKETGKDKFQDIVIKKARKITNFYAERGKLKQIKVLKSKRLIIKDHKNNTDIKTSDADIQYNPGTGSVKKIILPKKSQLSNRGVKNFDIAASEITVLYNDKGDIINCSGTGQCKFLIDEFTGTTGAILYNLEKEVIRLNGNPSYVNHKNNRFEANRFSVDVQKKILQSSGSIKSMVIFKEKNVFFSKNPIIILSRKVLLYNEQNRIIYESGVRLLQGDTKLNAETIDISKHDDITASRNVLFEYKEEKGSTRIQGEVMSLNTREKTVKIEKKCVLERAERSIDKDTREEKVKSSKLETDLIQIKFDTENIREITGLKNVQFKRQDLSFKADKLYWDYTKSLVRFVGSVVWEKTNKSKTTAEEIILDLNTDSITVKSGKKERTETIIE